ncbi:E3 ubiquitin-protein ligase TRAIP-like [Anoplophora glabripennis]|uniref:E3 ubiquitin-protein ligase TRAIP-like n=1 Tax=Anoplophora glabripennis TaxID=217634 RepID=UPI0008746DFB|nr:E3 ubiquitin-protein ligase TRAIP-like [Anoplophora glabripennis]
MNISCVICSDLFNPAAEVYITQCGHMFHFACLLHWIERSKTCPQCRCKSTEKTIHRVYFNLANTDGITDDVGTLMSKLENIQFQMSLKEKDVKIYQDKYKKSLHKVTLLREEVTELESKMRVHESAMHALKEQISYFKSKARDSDKLAEEVMKLKHSIKDMENIQIALNGTREEVNEILRNENNIESLAILSATLKKSLLDAERKKRDMDYNLKRAQNDSNKYRREVTTLECQNNDLRKEMQYLRDNMEKEKQYLKNKICELNKKISAENLDVTNTSFKRIITESPVNFNKTPQLSASHDINDTASPSLEEKVQKIVDSDSPYLPVKSSNIPLDYASLLHSKTKIGATKNGFSIFKTATKTLDNIKQLKVNHEVVYNGLGGSSREEVFPSPKPTQTGLKRHKSGSAISSSKFRKLAPTATKTKVTQFLNQANSQ